MKLNIGCGDKILVGWLNCDIKEGSGVERVFDTSQAPIPFENDSIEEILVNHVLEHIWKWEDAVMEFHRVLIPGGILTVRVPYGQTYTAYHVRFFKPETLDAFIDPQPYEQCCQFEFDKPLFRLEKKEVFRVFWLGWHLEHYLGIKLLSGKRYRFPFGQKKEIHWRLTKIGGKEL